MMFRRRSMKGSEPIKIFTKPQIYTVPKGLSKISIFIIGGGGGGSGDSSDAYHAGNGGNGGQCITWSTTELSGSSWVISDIYSIEILKVGEGGVGGSSNNSFSNATSGGQTVIRLLTEIGGLVIKTITANGGSRGEVAGGLNGAVGQLGGKGSNWADATDGTIGKTCSFNKTSYAGGGGGGNNSYGGYDYKALGKDGGGNGGCGNNNTPENKGQDATNFGGGGGGGAFSSGHQYGQGGNGYQGAVIIYLEK